MTKILTKDANGNLLDVVEQWSSYALRTLLESRQEPSLDEIRARLCPLALCIIEDMIVKHPAAAIIQTATPSYCRTIWRADHDD